MQGKACILRVAGCQGAGGLTVSFERCAEPYSAWPCTPSPLAWSIPASLLLQDLCTSGSLCLDHCPVLHRACGWLPDSLRSQLQCKSESKAHPNSSSTAISSPAGPPLCHHYHTQTHLFVICLPLLRCKGMKAGALLAIARAQNNAGHSHCSEYLGHE